MALAERRVAPGAASPMAAFGGHSCWEGLMLICYVDEAGNIGVYQPLDPSSTPVFTVVGISVDDDHTDDLLMDHVLGLLENYACHICGRVLVKKPGELYSATSTYPSAVADLATTLDCQACASQKQALMILDAQTKVKNEVNVHTITTRRFRHGGNAFPSFVESPVFGHSDTHVLLQLADIVASALIYPLACVAYLPTIPGDAHRDPSYLNIRTFIART